MWLTGVYKTSFFKFSWTSTDGLYWRGLTAPSHISSCKLTLLAHWKFFWAKILQYPTHFSSRFTYERDFYSFEFFFTFEKCLKIFHKLKNISSVDQIFRNFRFYIYIRYRGENIAKCLQPFSKNWRCMQSTYAMRL